MEMKFVNEGPFVCFENENGKFMRIQCADIAQSAKDMGQEVRNYLWYRMVPQGWVVTVPRELEACYQEMMKARMQ